MQIPVKPSSQEQPCPQLSWQLFPLVKCLFFASLSQVCLLVAASKAGAELEPLNNAAPFFRQELRLRATKPLDTGKDLLTTRGEQTPAFTTSGYLEATFYPPHNEYDPNFGRDIEDLTAARYALSADASVFHRSGLFARLYLFMPMGNSRPQTDYNYAADPILLAFQPTLGYQFRRGLDLRITYNEKFNLGGFDSKPETQPWLGLSLRLAADGPFEGKLAWLSGYVESFIFAPTLEYPATPGASPDDSPVIRFGRDDIVNARYEIELNGKIQIKWKYLDRFFLFGAPKFFFGDAGIDDQSSWSAAPLTVLLEYGVGIQLTQQSELRVTHSLFRDLGNAPEGLERLYATGIALRWSW